MREAGTSDQHLRCHLPSDCWCQGARIFGGCPSGQHGEAALRQKPLRGRSDTLAMCSGRRFRIQHNLPRNWVAAEELELRYQYPYYGNLNEVPEQQPRKRRGWDMTPISTLFGRSSEAHVDRERASGPNTVHVHVAFSAPATYPKAGFSSGLPWPWGSWAVAGCLHVSMCYYNLLQSPGSLNTLVPSFTT